MGKWGFPSRSPTNLTPTPNCKNALRVAVRRADRERMRMGLAAGTAALALLAPAAMAGMIEGSVALTPADRSFRGGTKPNAYVGQLSGSEGHSGPVVAADSGYGVAYVVDVAGAAPAEPALLDQNGQKFIPRILAVVVGQTVEFRNSDKVFHNVFSYSPPKRFDLGRYPRGKSKRLTFQKAGFVQVFCDIHSEMRADIVVVPGPHYTYLDSEGRFRIKGVPAGRHTVAIWLPRSGERRVVLDVPERGASRVALTSE